ncbi:MAG: sigma-70 family RNA polymerase sigma factor [Planctomycetota bacterium]
MVEREHESPELLERLRNGDESALSELFDLHRARMRRIVQFRMHPRVLQRVDPDDVLQEVWLDAQKRIGSYATQEDPSGFLWLRLVLGQTMIDLHRRHVGAQRRSAKQEVSLHHGAGPAAQSDAMSIHLSGSFTSPSGAVQRDEMVVLLRESLDEMEEMDREVLMLRHLEELSNTEAAAVLGIQASAASNRYVRALARLKGLLEGRGGGM